MNDFGTSQATFTAFHLFCGIGGGALGFQEANEEWRGLHGNYRTFGAVDADPEACEDFEALTGARATCLDLFSSEQYRDFHGTKPPSGWREAGPQDLVAITGGVAPDIIFTSPPCKGFSGLLPQEKADQRKYQALNKLVTRGLLLAMEAWRNDLPAFVLLENVPRITSRGGHLLREIKGVLRAYGYVFSEGYHDCGELGNLAQHRRRYLFIARNPSKVPAFVYHPPRRRVRAIGEVLGPLPMPDDPDAGPLHRLPRLHWKTWVRLALIPAGGDWRDLQGIEAGQYRLKQNGQHTNKYRVQEEPARTVTGSDRVGSGAPALADPRLSYQSRSGAYRVGSWEKPASTVIGSASVRGSNGMAAVADPRPKFNNMLRMTAWDESAGAVTGAAGPNQSATLVADPRLGCESRPNLYGVADWHMPTSTVTGSASVSSSNGVAAVADPRIPADDERPDPPPVIIALDGTWHRPLTTLELAALQGFPTTKPDGSPLTLAGNSDRRWRERIGNAVPPPAARAIGEAILRALLPSREGLWVLSKYGTPIWVNGRESDVIIHAP